MSLDSAVASIHVRIVGKADLKVDDAIMRCWRVGGPFDPKSCKKRYRYPGTVGDPRRLLVLYSWLSL